MDRVTTHTMDQVTTHTMHQVTTHTMDRVITHTMGRNQQHTIAEIKRFEKKLIMAWNNRKVDSNCMRHDLKKTSKRLQVMNKYLHPQRYTLQLCFHLIKLLNVASGSHQIFCLDFARVLEREDG